LGRGASSDRAAVDRDDPAAGSDLDLGTLVSSLDPVLEAAPFGAESDLGPELVNEQCAA
jgi:hypothetical protein